MAGRKETRIKGGTTILFFIKHKTLLLILIPLLFYFVLRIHAANLPVADKFAEQNVEARYRSSGKENLIGTPQFSQEVEKLSEQYQKVYTDKDGNQYLLGVDSYTYLSQARGILSGGKASSLLPYLEVYSYKFLKFFSSKTTLIQAAFWLPFVVTLFSIILIFFIARKLTNDMGGFFAAFILAVHPQFFTATQAGFTDTNFLNLFFTLLIVFLFFEGIDLGKGLKNNKKQLIFLALIIPVTYLFSLTWNGWFYIIFILFVFIAIYSLLYLFKKSREGKSKKYYIILAVVLTILLFSVYLSKDTAFVKLRVNKVKERVGMYSVGYLFPSSSSTTSELLSASEAQKLKGSSQGPLLYLLNDWILAILAVYSVILMIKKNYKLGEKTKHAFFILLWFFIMFLVGYKSIRFISFFALPFSIVVSYGTESIFSYFQQRLPKYKKSIVAPALVIILILLIILPISKILFERLDRTPFMTSIIERTSDELKKSDKDAIVNLWWDKGYFYSYYSERAVSMDNGVGGSSDPRIYWTSRAYLSRDENDALQILKLMNCKSLPDNPLANPNVNISQINCTPPEAFMLLDSGLIGKVDIFGYYASWDFNLKTHEQFTQPEIPLISAPANCLINNEKTRLTCSENFILDMASSKLAYKGTEFPFVMVIDDKLYYSELKGPYSLLVYPEIYEGSRTVYKSVLLKSDMLDTMFVRLLFMKGIGSKHFEPFSDIADPIAGRVIVYKIRWPAQ